MSSHRIDPQAEGTQRAGQIKLGVRWNRITPQELLDVLSRSVAGALSKHASYLPRSRRRELRMTVMRLFIQGVKSRARTMVGLPKQTFLQELDRNKDRLLMQCDEARAELTRLKGSVGQLRSDLPEAQPTTPAQDRQLDQELEEGLRRVFDRHGQGGPEYANVREGVLGFVLASARSQRWQHLKGRLTEHRGQIDMLERRINKLTEALDRTEKALHEVIHARQLDEAGIASIYRQVQGLSVMDAQLHVKREMMKDIFHANLELQGFAA